VWYVLICSQNNAGISLQGWRPIAQSLWFNQYLTRIIGIPDEDNDDCKLIASLLTVNASSSDRISPPNDDDDEQTKWIIDQAIMIAKASRIPRDHFVNQPAIDIDWSNRQLTDDNVSRMLQHASNTRCMISRINLQGNRLTQVPFELQHIIASLHSLNVSDNDLSELPLWLASVDEVQAYRNERMVKPPKSIVDQGPPSIKQWLQSTNASRVTMKRLKMLLIGHGESGSYFVEGC
jgi:hypothetical protein